MNKIQVYYLLHFSGILLVFYSYASLITRAVLTSDPKRNDGLLGRKAGAILSGIGLLMILVSGFGLQAVLQIGWPLWFIIKFGIWVILAAMIGLINRNPHMGRTLWVVTLLLGLAAVASVVIKPTLG